MGQFEGIESVPQNELLYTSRLLEIGRDAVRKSGLIDCPGEPNELDIMRELEPTVERELARHNRIRKSWVPADFLPIDVNGKILHRQTDPDAIPMLSPAAKAAMLVNLLTEDNLPSYHRIIADNFGADGAWGTWAHQWTAEEANHSYTMRAFLDLTRAIDPTENEHARMAQVQQGYMVEKGPLNTLVYVTFQELATRVSHRQTGSAADNELADAMLVRISKDENLHMLFYRNLTGAAIDIAPAQTLHAIHDELKNFVMPGSNIANFQISALRIAEAGIYDPRRHLDEIVAPVLKHWKIFERDLSGEAAYWRDEIAKLVTTLEMKASRFDESRDSGKLRSTITALESRQK